MRLEVTILLTRNLERYALDVHTPVSATVTPGCTHPGCDCVATVELDPGLDLLDAREREAAEMALIEAFEAASLPYSRAA